MNNAALYLRSSKDRADISLAAQRHELEALAASRSLAIVKSYEDAVQSGSTEHRPAFQSLVADLKNRNRGWSHLLALDTSRLARGRFIAQAFKRECAKHGVTILYAKMPETDPISQVILESVFEAMDEVHSLLSRDKGMEGMRENVRQGFRAGGRAPIGYVLVHTPTGTFRDGKPVMKSKLALAAEADVMRAYLAARARGVPRMIAKREAGATMPANSLIGVEWNALTYAGHTVWNRHHEMDRNQNRTGHKRRPRAEWQIQRETHPALISDAQAETILRTLETSDMSAALSKARSVASDYLLTGMLETTGGERWVGHGAYYRLRRGRRCVRSAEIDGPVLARFDADLRSDLFLREFIRCAQHTEAPTADLEAEITRLTKERRRASLLAISGEDGGEFLKMIQERTRQIDALEREAAAVRIDDSVSAALRRLTPADILALLDAHDTRHLLPQMVAKVVLEPDLSLCQIEYQPPSWLTVASPRGFEPLLPP